MPRPPPSSTLFPYTTLFRSLFIAMLVNIFLKSTGLDFVISGAGVLIFAGLTAWDTQRIRSEEHTSELQSRPHLVCRLLLEKKNNTPLRILSIPTSTSIPLRA